MAMNSSFKRSALSVALGLCFVGGVQAQTNSAGAVAGRAAAGDTVTVTNPSTGFSRTITVGSDGNYRFSQLSTGTYQISRNGAAPRSVVVNVGTASNVDFVAGSSNASGTLDAINVTAAVNPIDVSSVESSTVLSAAQVKALPVSTNVTAVALLAPGTVRGDAAFGNLASFGGASVAENQYYLNGFAITNSFRSLAFSQVPYEAVAEQQIKTGGYGAEFGRSTGGVVNLISKRGTNEFHAGGNVYYTPKSLTEDGRNTYYPTTGAIRSDNSRDNEESWRTNVWAGGALIKDRLFAYGLLSYGKTQNNSFGSILSSTNVSSENKTPNWLLKLDWEINDSHRLEFTGFSDTSKTETDIYRNALGSLERGAFMGTNFLENGGNNYVLKYTGYLTDNFTLSALGGYGKYSRSQHLTLADGTDVRYGGDINQPASGCPIIADVRNAARRAITGTYSSTCNLTGGAIARADSEDTRKQFRLDAEWQLGSHILRGGVDIDQYTSVAGASSEGGRVWRYSTLANGTDIVREQIVNQGTTVEVKQRAFYIEDSWNVTDNFLAYLGVRSDTFQNYNGFGEEYVGIKNQIAPRLGFSWDVNGDSTFKVFGNAGRYALPLTPSVAVRGASASLFTRQQFTFTSVDPVTGAPVGIVPRAGATGQLTYINGEFGSAKTAATIASKNLKPMYQDEFILGFQKQLTDHTSLGVRAIQRDLKAAIDDNCDYAPVMAAGGFTYDDDAEAWLDSSGRAAQLPGAGFPYCRMFNPGEDAVFTTDFYGDGQLRDVTVPGAALSPKAKRKYTALEVSLAGNWDRAFMQGSYTYAKGRGNTEGGVKSDIGQADTSVTQDFDYKELMVDAYGHLPNDRRHSFKLLGGFNITDEWTVGGNFLVQSGRPVNCLGTLEVAPGSFHPYGASFFRCNQQPVPRGTAGRLPWTQQLDLGVTYKPMWAKGLMVKLDVTNLLNKQKITSVSETAEDGATGNPLDTYLLPTSYQTPRNFRFMVQYEF